MLENKTGNLERGDFSDGANIGGERFDIDIGARMKDLQNGVFVASKGTVSMQFVLVHLRKLHGGRGRLRC